MPTVTLNNNQSQALSFVYLRVSSNQNNSNEKPNAVPVNEQNELSADITQTPLENKPADSPEIPPPLILQTEPSMEVHHHGHVHETKKWREYLFQFLMLFLAVFCGFLAENYREHYVEHQRAKQLANNLYKEIYADSIALEQKIAFRNKKEEECIYFINYVKDSSLTNLSSDFYRAFTWAFLSSAHLLFEPNDGILNQLRNSGELRYFKNSDLQSAIGRLTVQVANVRGRNEKEYGFIETNLRPFTVRHYDFNWYKVLTQDGKFTLLEALNQDSQVQFAGKIIDLDKFNRKEAENIASYYLLMLRGTRQTQYLTYVAISHQLLQILRKEYYLK
jgi:hypothetical protein